MPDDEKIIYFPGCEPGGPRSKGPLREVELTPPETEGGTPAGVGLDGMMSAPPEIEKAMGIILSGTPFVIVGVRPTERGADFVSTAFGDKTALQNALPHLADMQARALSRYGVS